MSSPGAPDPSSSPAAPAGALARLRVAWGELTPNLRGMLLVLIAMLFFTVEQVAAKTVGGSLPTAQLAFVRSFAQLVLVMPFLVSAGIGVLRTSHLRLHLLRSTFGVIGLYCYYYSVVRLPLATSTTLSFTKSLFQTMLAAWILGELVRRHRRIATLVGFIGVLIVVRPGAEGPSVAALAGLAGAATGAALMITTKVLAQRESTLSIMVYIALILTAVSAVPGLLAWRTPTVAEVPWLVVIGLFGPIGQYFAISGWRAGEASFLAPVDYLRLVMSAAAGFLVFAEIPDLGTAVGAAIIVFSTLALTRRELGPGRRGRE